jgi:integrase
MQSKTQRAKNGQGHTYTFRNGYRTVIKQDGRVITATGRTMTESKRNAQEKLKRLQPLNKGLAEKGGALTLEEFIIPWMKERHQQEVAYSTFERYSQLIRCHINPLIGHVKLMELNKRHVDQMLSAMNLAGQSKRSQRQARAVLSVAMSGAVKEEILAFNPVANARKIKIEHFEFEPLKIEEVGRVIRSAETTQLKLRWTMALFYGLRQGEALGLRWRDIDFNTKTVQVTKQMQTIRGKRELVGLKTKSSRRALRLSDETILLMKRHKSELAERKLRLGKDWVENDLVFPNTEGRPMQSRWDNTLWKRTLSSAKVSHRRLHDARHTAATMLYNDETDIEVIRRFLGHSSVELTSRT